MSLALGDRTGGAAAPSAAAAEPGLPAGTSTAPTGRALWTRWRGPLLAAAVLVLVSLVVAVLRGTGDAGLLDPRAYDPQGSRAVAALLEDRGVPVRVVGDLPGLRRELGPGSTVLLPRPDQLTPEELGELADLDAPLVVVGAGPRETGALGLPVEVAAADVEVRRPGCSLPDAVTAGAAPAGRATYAVQDGQTEAVGCYADAGVPTLLVLPEAATTLLGAGDVLTNDAVDREGAAALALGLLGDGDEVLWLLPDAGRAVEGARRPISELLPDAVVPAVVQVGVAVVLLALWRGRRLGRVVPEPLPVVVRAAEAVEGRGRLYRAAGARDSAAEALRSGARDRLARALGLPPDADRQRLVGTLAARSGRPAAALDELLHGPPPVDDAALVRLAEDLDALEAWRTAPETLPDDPRPTERTPS